MWGGGGALTYLGDSDKKTFLKSFLTLKRVEMYNLMKKMECFRKGFRHYEM